MRTALRLASMQASIPPTRSHFCTLTQHAVTTELMQLDGQRDEQTRLAWHIVRAACGSRWLLLRNSSLSVTDVYEAINRPALKNSSLSAQRALSSTNAGSLDDFMYYIRTGVWGGWHE